MMCSLKDMALSIGNPKIHCFVIANLGVPPIFRHSYGGVPLPCSICRVKKPGDPIPSRGQVECEHLVLSAADGAGRSDDGCYAVAG